jgi:very-short-patch-repair endonuclease
MTPPEVIIWQELRGRKLDGIRFPRQHPIGPYILDFYCSELRLAIEVDGRGHDFEERLRHDERREAWLTEQGVKVLRIAARNVLDPKMRQYVFWSIFAAIRGE